MKPRPTEAAIPRTKTVTTSYRCDDCEKTIQTLSMEDDVGATDACLNCGSFLIHIVE